MNVAGVHGWKGPQPHIKNDRPVGLEFPASLEDYTSLPETGINRAGEIETGNSPVCFLSLSRRLRGYAPLPDAI